MDPTRRSTWLYYIGYYRMYGANDRFLSGGWLLLIDIDCWYLDIFRYDLMTCPYYWIDYLVGGLEHFSHKWYEFIVLIDELIFFRGAGRPLTSIVMDCYVILWNVAEGYVEWYVEWYRMLWTVKYGMFYGMLYGTHLTYYHPFIPSITC